MTTMTDFETFRDPFLSLYQSAVTEVGKRLDESNASLPKATFRERSGLQRSAASSARAFATDIARREYQQSLGQAPTSAGVAERELTAPDRLRVCAEIAFRYMKARVEGDQAALAMVSGEFEKGACDPLWAQTIEEHLKFFGLNGQRNAIPYRRATDVGSRSIVINAKVRIALMGDWGTGAQPAISVLKQIAAAKPDIVIHLGDVYYSGTPAECRDNFRLLVDQLLRRDNPTLPIFTLAGNHDMYSGGLGYYALIDELNVEPHRQPASYFCLRTADQAWQFLAMDTGYHDNNPVTVTDAVTFLEEDELGWHLDRIREFPGRTILLSHHQLFSAYSPIGPAAQDGSREATNPRLLEAFTQLTTNGRIAGWFWGHEHTLSIYKAFAGLERGRCLGHGGVPVSLADDVYKLVEGLALVPEVVDDGKLGAQGGVYAHGFAILDLDVESAKATYFEDVNDKAVELFSETLV
jgi:hypothetical protein